jgi:hypothetical protein
MKSDVETNKAPGAPMYASAEKIYPREMKGRFDSLSKLATIILLGLFYFVPWLTWDDRQAVLFDLPARKFYLLGLTLWPQDFPYLAMLLIIAALSLFFFTALLGRVWCGFACPQTVWTEAFIWMEQWTEGTRSQRMKLDKAPWSWNKLRRKSSKQFLWVTFSLWTGFTFVGFFVPIRELGPELLTYSVLDALLRFRHVRQRRLHARAGLQVHVSLRAFPERDVRQGHADHLLRRETRRSTRQPQAH